MSLRGTDLRMATQCRSSGHPPLAIAPPDNELARRHLGSRRTSAVVIRTPDGILAKHTSVYFVSLKISSASALTRTGTGVAS
jgi:hypothetical protein